MTDVHIVSIDIKDGWMDIIHVFRSRRAAEEYVAWQLGFSGDFCHITTQVVEDEWIPPDTSGTPAQGIW